VKSTYLLTPSRRNIVDQFKDRLDRISELSEDELKAFREELLTEFKTVDNGEITKDSVEAMKFLSSTFQATKAEQARRVEEASTLAAEAAEAAAAMKDDEEPAEDEEEEDATELTSEEPVEAEAAVEEAAEEPTTPTENVDTPGVEEEIVTVEDEEVETPAGEPEVVEAEADTETEAAADEVVEEEEDEDDEDETKKASEASAEDVSETPTNEVAELATEDSNTESSEEPVTASSTPATPEDRRPSAKEAAPLYTITAGADVPNLPMGSTLPNLRAVAQALVERKKAWGNIGGNGDGEKSTVAKFRTSYPEDRVLSETDLKGNRSKVEAVVASAMKRDETGALIAAGGLVAPINVRYELFGFSESTDRPVRDSLIVFNADRGGIRYITPPVLDDVKTGAVSLWTIEDDEAAAVEGATTPVKPCLRVTAGSEVNVYIEAIPLCLTFGNLVSRTYPELVERHTELAMVWHARYAETRLLTRIGALSTSVSAPAELGAARDIFNQVDQAAAAYRNRHRIDSKTPLRVIFPEWFKNALRIDLTKQLPGDGQDVTFNLADADITRWFASRNINVTWHIDGEEGQIFGAQTAGNLLAFPEQVIWYLFAEGTFLFLDGGELDLGLVRDSTLNGTNDYKIFLETFEGVAKIGIEALRITSDLALIGASSGTVDLATAATAPTV
jgi:hypothetical protein